MKTISLVMAALVLSAVTLCYGQEPVIGEITSTMQERLHVGVGDSVMTTLAHKDGIIKGDLLKVTDGKDSALKGDIGRCAVLRVYGSSSLCKIIRAKLEVGRGDKVEANRLIYEDAAVFEQLLLLLNSIVEPYEPHKEISVYIHQIFDHKNDLTKFSQQVRKEMVSLFSQKPRIRLVAGDGESIFAFYPHEYGDRIRAVKEFMRKDGVDVVLYGVHKQRGDKTELSVFVIDKNYGDRVVTLELDSKDYMAAIAAVAAPYRPVVRKENILCNVSYQPRRYVLRKDEIKDIIDYESGGDPFIQYTLGRTDFNILSPVGFQLRVDDDVITFDGKTGYAITLPRGSHRVVASFRRGYFFNESLMFSSVKEVKREFGIILDRDGDVELDLQVDPLYGKENITLKVLRRVERERRIMRPILRSDAEKPIETFKD